MKTVFLSRVMTIRYTIILLLPILFLLYPQSVFPEETIDDALKPDEALEEELKYLQEETYVITPSKIPQRIEKAPGTIYVVTDRQIRQMGARYLSDVVQTVPGWFVREIVKGGITHFYVRGDAGGGGNRVSYMVNSHLVNDVYNGVGTVFYSNLDLDNVKRIEFRAVPRPPSMDQGPWPGLSISSQKRQKMWTGCSSRGAAAASTPGRGMPFSAKPFMTSRWQLI